MDWIFDNLGKFFSLIVFIFYIFTSLKGKGEEEEPDPEAQARARKIQEEIRRKILERQGGAPPVPEQRREVVQETPYAIELEDQPNFAEPVELEERGRWEYEEEEPEEEEPEVFVAAEDPFAEQKRQIEEQLAKAAALKEKVSHKHSSDFAERTRRHVHVSEIRQNIQAGLSDRGSLKSAFVLKEILDTPIGLR